MTKKHRISQAIRNLILILFGAAMIFPFLWMIASSFKTGRDVFNISILPKPFSLDNYQKLLSTSMFPRWFLNSGIITLIVVLSVLFFDSLLGFTFAKYKFRGKSLSFILILSTMMIPTEMLVIPWYIISNKLKWVDTYWGIMFPGLMSAFGTFLMRQFFFGIPEDLFDAGRMDGLHEFWLFWRIGLPLVKPAMSALAIFTFIGNWNAYLWPLIISTKKVMYTLPVGLALFNGEFLTEWNIIMTGATVATVPILVLYMLFQKQIIQGIALTGVKG